MEQFLTEISIDTNGAGFTDITSRIDTWLSSKEIELGILVISCKHTSCSLIINENADNKVLKDLSNYMNSIVPNEGIKSGIKSERMIPYSHSQEGLDDMPAHIKTVLTGSNLNLSISEGKLLLGTWQGIYLWEHRYMPNKRKLHLHVIGEAKR